MTQLRVAAGALSLLLTSVAAAQPLPRADSPEAVGLSSERLQRLPDAFAADVKDGSIPGAVVLVLRHEKVAYAATRAIASRDHRAGSDASHFRHDLRNFRIARNDRAIVPIGAFQARYGVTLSLPAVIERDGVAEVFEPEMTDEEREAFGS